MGRSPAFQCYAKDLYTGTSDLSAAEFGAFWRGVCWSWDNGPLPLKPDPRRRALLLDKKEFARIWPQIRGLWKRTAKGFVNTRLETVRKEQDAFREKQAEKARKRHSHGNATAEPRQDSGIVPAHATGMPSDLRSASASSEDQNQDQEPAPSAVTFPQAVEITPKPNIRVIGAVVRKSGLIEGDGPEIDEVRKIAVARADVGPYSGEALRKAVSAQRAMAQRLDS